MKLQLGLWLAIFSAAPIGAATIDISADTRTTVRTGDTLVFHLLTSNFALDAAAFGLPVNPSEISFALVSAPLDVGSRFAATLESPDRAVSVAFGDLTFGPGYFQSSGYAGGVSTLQGRLDLTPAVSKVLFSSTFTVIALLNEGPDVELGLAPYTLRQSLYASLTGETLSIGAVVDSVDLDGHVTRTRVNSFGAMSFTADTSVPEPQTGGLFLLGGVVLCGFSAIFRRISRRAALQREKSTVCIR
jgi:hypothetical protein